MAATNFFGGQFFGGGFFGANTPTTTVDTHDGFDVDDTEAKRKKRLHDAIAYAIDPESFALPAAEEIALQAAPYIERMESGAPRIDWRTIEAEAVLRSRLYALAEEFERQRLEAEADEEDVMILLLH